MNKKDEDEKEGTHTHSWSEDGGRRRKAHQDERRREKKEGRNWFDHMQMPKTFTRRRKRDTE